jgi:hypothetical protein
MYQIKSKYNGKYDSIYLLFIGDLHIGNKHFNKKYLYDALKFAKINKNRTRIILMGDLIECSTKTSVGRSVFDEDFPVYKQFDYSVNIFNPYVDMIDTVVEGNHEERIIKDTSFEIVQEFCKRLGIMECYGKFNSVLNIDTGNLVYSVNIWHGCGGGTTESSSINRMLKMRENCLAHIYAMGHTHKLLSFEKVINIPDINNNKVLKVNQLFINTGSALDNGGYGEQKGLPNNYLGYGLVEIFKNKRKMIFHKVVDMI